MLFLVSPMAFCSSDVKFERIYPDMSKVNCNRSLFKSTVQDSNIIFIAPEILPGSGPNQIGREQTKTIEVEKKKNGNYNVILYIYFPNSRNEITPNSKHLMGTKDVCNFLEIKNSLPIDKADSFTITPLPISSIRMTIDGVASIGSSELNYTTNSTIPIQSYLNHSSTIDYYGKAVPIYFELTEDEYQVLQSKITSSSGLQSEVHLFFESRKKSTSVSVSFNSKDIIKKIDAEIDLKAKISESEIKAKLQNILNSSNLTIDIFHDQSNQEKSIDNQKYIDKVIEKALLFIKAEKNSKSSKEEHKNNNPIDIINANVLIENLKKFINNNIKFSIYDEPSESVTKNLLNFKVGRIPDPNSTEIELFSSEPAKMLALNLIKGQTIEIIPLFHSDFNVSYATENKYLSAEDITILELSKMFSIITDTNYEATHIENLISNDSILEYHPNFHKAALSCVKCLKYKYRFLQMNKIRKLNQISSYNYSTIENISDDLNEVFEISLSFSGINHTKKFKMADILNEKKYWTATFDSNTFTLKILANENLGNLFIYPNFSRQMKPNNSIKKQGQKNCDLNSPILISEVSNCKNIPKNVTNSVALVQLDNFSINSENPKIISELIMDYKSNLLDKDSSTRVKIVYPEN